MNFRTAKAYQPELVKDERRPRTITTRTSAEYFAACDRNGIDYDITAVNCFGPDTGNGGWNGQYELELQWRLLPAAGQPDGFISGAALGGVALPSRTKAAGNRIRT